RRGLAEVAQETGCWIVAGLSLREGGKFYNTAVAFDARGACAAEYRKIHLFPGKHFCEPEIFTPGNFTTSFESGNIKVGIMICYDLRFPELARSLCLAGTEVLIVPAAWPAIRSGHWVALLRARAIENQMYVLGVNRAGQDGASAMGGTTCAFDPTGEELCCAPETGQHLLVIDVDPQQVRDVRASIPCLLDRRPETYRL
ncbi:MAG: carbon-nitrogen family hydrolase, partial [Phycisphaerae bacterium]|nr:carbon-nitrogen family hydrolase [Phycisphaerae bacterium]